MDDAKTPDTGRLFHELGMRVEQRWRKANYHELALAEIAEQELREAALHERVDYLDVVRWLNRCPNPPRQFNMEANFGQPPITVFSGENFYIDVLNWLDGTTAIHRHSFSGAFQVLHGSSIHAEWDFEADLRVNPQLTLGNLKNRGVELLRQGEIRRILPAEKFIHSVFHLDHPSVSIVIRSTTFHGALPQYTYLRPHIEIDLFARGDTCARRMQALKMLWNLKHPAYEEELLEVLRNSDAFSALLVLEQHLGLEPDLARLGPALSVMQELHPQLMQYLVPCALVLQRQEQVQAKRTGMTDPAHRFFLAVSMNATNPRAAMDLVKLWSADRDPVDVVVGWVRELAASPNGASLLDFEFDPPALRALDGLLRGSPADSIKRQMEVDDTRARQILSALPSLPLLRPFLGEE